MMKPESIFVRGRALLIIAALTVGCGEELVEEKGPLVDASQMPQPEASGDEPNEDPLVNREGDSFESDGYRWVKTRDVVYGDASEGNAPTKSTAVARSSGDSSPGARCAFDVNRADQAEALACDGVSGA